jgi:murein DD-endopeptidase MepM/ murein hydrolase activator NlpD
MMRLVQATFAILVSLAAAGASMACPLLQRQAGMSPQLLRPGGGALSKQFGMELDDLLGVPKQHDGIDLDGASGDDVYAAADGEVVVAGHLGLLGNYLRINHGNGVETSYGHVSRFSIPNGVGDCVLAGQKIAIIGCTGLCSHPHLHFEVLRGGQFVDPEPLLLQSK